MNLNVFELVYRIDSNLFFVKIGCTYVYRRERESLLLVFVENNLKKDCKQFLCF